MEGVRKLQIVDEDAGRHGDVGLGFEKGHEFFVEWRGASAGAEGGGRRAEDDVGSGTARPVPLILQHAVAEADDRKDERHGKSDGQDAEARADGAVLEIFVDELINQDSSLASLPRRLRQK